MYFFKENINIQLIIFLIFLIWISYLVYTDNRFKFNRKVLFFFIIAVLLIFSYYLDKVPYLIIKDLFWYSLVLNLSFIIHVLILDRIFYFCWKKHYEYFGFIISRVSFTISIWGIIYCLNEISKSIINNIVNYKIKNKLLLLLHKVYQLLYVIIKIILLYFSIIFHNYSLLLLGVNNNKITIKNILIYFCFFFIFLILSIIFEIPRLYLFWFFYFFIEFFNIIKEGYKENIEKKKFIDNLKNIFTGLKVFNLYIDRKGQELWYIYEKPYHKFFMCDLLKFITGWIYYNENDPYYHSYQKTLFLISEGICLEGKYPIEKVYNFYPWEEMAIHYATFLDRSELADQFYREPEERIKEALFWCTLINADKHEFLKKTIPDLFLKEKN